MTILYVVATPIGNLEDISARASRILESVSVIAAEDTRRTGQLLASLGIRNKLVQLQSHNEDRVSTELLKTLQSGNDVAMVSDAGTPLISDPGFQLVRDCHELDIPVVPIPGPSALTAALSASGIPTNRFVFEGFVPAKANARKLFLENLRSEPRTLVCFEAPHRIVACMKSICEVLGTDRQVSLCRELTKTYEQIVCKPAQEILILLESAQIVSKGEFVVIVAPGDQGSSMDSERLLRELLKELPLGKASAIAAKMTSATRSELYALGTQIKQELE